MKRFIHDERKELLKKVEESKETGPEEMISSEATIESPYTKSSDDPDDALVMNMDKILVLDNGKCIGYGTHEELLLSCKDYRETYEVQMGAMAE